MTTTTTTDDATQQLLRDAQVSIAKAQRLIAADGPAPTPPILVHPGDNLLAILADAAAGAVVLIDPLFVADLGHWALPKPVTLACAAQLPPGRIDPTAQLPTLHGILAAGDVPQVRFVGIRVVGYTPDGTLITAGPQSSFDRVVALGSPNGQHRGIAMNNPDITVSGCHIANIWKDQDTQACGGWNNAKRHRILDSYLEASGENFCYGGTDADNEAAMPEDITVDGCTLYKPPAWRGRPDMTIKNLFEIKNARKVRVRNCLMENCWANGQDGAAFLLSVRNQDGGNPWATIQDVIVEDNVLRHLGSGMKITGSDSNHPSGTMADVIVRRNVFEDIDPSAYGGDGRQLLLQMGGKNLTFEDNVSSGHFLNTFIAFGIPDRKYEGFRYVGNSAYEGEYGIHGEASPGLGKPALDFYIPGGYDWERNTVIKDQRPQYDIVYPDGTTVVLATGRRPRTFRH